MLDSELTHKVSKVHSFQHLVEFVRKNAVQFVDLRFADTFGKEQHLTLCADQVSTELLETGKMFDGSSIAGWRGIENSDMVLLPDITTAVMDPFAKHLTLILNCDVIDPITQQPYSRCPRSLARRAEKYLLESGIGDEAAFGPEVEFFIFDDVRFGHNIHSAFYALDSAEAAWNSGKEMASGNLSHRPSIKGGYFPVPPKDSLHDLRSHMSLVLRQMGLTPELHHHEVATAGQCELGIKYNTLLKKADEIQVLKYVIQNIAHQHGKTATFMPKPLMGDNGSGMHCHQSIMKNGLNIFSGDKESSEVSGLSETALYYIGGILKHARALNAFTNPGTNSYKRLVPGFEAPVYLAYGSCNRSAAIRVPYTTHPFEKRIEVRFPDPLANPYFAFSAMLMAGLDGIQKRLHPGKAISEDLYDEKVYHAKTLGTVSFSLESAIEHLEQDHDFLLQGDVFNTDLISAYIKLKKQEVQKLREMPHPVEFELYY